MSEFSLTEQLMMTKDLSDQQKMLFESQFNSAKKDRGLILVLSVLFGYWGVDRFMIGDIGLGVLKLLTLGLCGILWLIDLFRIQAATDDYNRKKAQEILMSIKMAS